MKTMLFVCLLGVPGDGQGPAAWRDSSKHQVQFLTVEDGVRLEVLDWGGTGQPVVLLAGYNTAHVFDDFAVKLSEMSHVYGITRRGYGASSRPDSGYTAQRSAEDVRRVLDALKLSKPVLVGHSFGGQDLSTLGANHPERIAALVYLNSAEDATLGEWIWPAIGVVPSELEAAHKKLPAAMRKPAASPDYKSFEAYRAWQMRTHGVSFPESELRQLFGSNPDGSMGPFITPKSVREAIFAGVQKPDYARIRVPVLAFFTTPRPLADEMQRYKPQMAEERAALEQVYTAGLGIVKKHMRDLQAGVPSARVIEVAGANYFVFLSHEAEVLRELRAFVAGLR